MHRTRLSLCLITLYHHRTKQRRRRSFMSSTEICKYLFVVFFIHLNKLTFCFDTWRALFLYSYYISRHKQIHLLEIIPCESKTSPVCCLICVKRWKCLLHVLILFLWHWSWLCTHRLVYCPELVRLSSAVVAQLSSTFPASLWVSGDRPHLFQHFVSLK